MRGVLRWGVALLFTVAPVLAQLPDLATWKEIPYGKTPQQDLWLDLYIPKGTASPPPLVVWIHGGGWQAGSRDNPPALYLTKYGYAVASLSYRLSQTAKWPAQREDCLSAIRWLRSNGKTYGIDTRRIGVWGSSAGGHLAAMTGVYPQAADAISHRVQAVVDFFGPTDLLQMSKFPSRIDHDAPGSPESKLLGGPLQENKEAASTANPIRFVTRDDPPFLIVHGDQDPAVPLNQSELLHEALRQAGVESRFEVLPGAGHGGPAFQSERVLTIVAEFFGRHLKGKK